MFPGTRSHAGTRASQEARAMSAALEAAARGERGANPLVGAAVLAADGTVVTGWHHGAGTPHAEVDAVQRARAAGIDLTTATMVVTLEPCNHTGRSGPCSQFLLDAGIRRVVHAIDDPNPRASGGAAHLRAHGVEVVSGVRAEEAERLNARWIAAQRAARPYVTLKLAQSLDGRIAAADGTSRWITSAESRAHAHTLRARVDAILVGTGTALADDPRLTARTRDGRPAGAQPRPVIIGFRELAAGSHLARDPRTLHLRTRDPLTALRALAGAGVGHVLVEGGAHIAGAFLAAGLVDELHLYTAPILLGDGLPALAGLDVGTLAEAHRFVADPAGPAVPARLGPDTFHRLVPAVAHDSEQSTGDGGARTPAVIAGNGDPPLSPAPTPAVTHDPPRLSAPALSNH
ncbi:bifunctional diaminohydroxyphosphoribosylaminopyrimidine deaminase/5-amino-6-(5-phosphoribosylamino)uracil reductase RibD [Brevibacterium sp. NPDC049920]|uniref:bifunctional diaminohydroxyphosphoribosylaminopyrimidine deaminase/5-amino-6-(5-phosphoribosylamino)uracil reductase RibD n=1 Tax=Brevibacterium sp. NPDC049920 TaxID=3155279 RepID=UPI003410FFE2